MDNILENNAQTTDSNLSARNITEIPEDKDNVIHKPNTGGYDKDEQISRKDFQVDDNGTEEKSKQDDIKQGSSLTEPEHDTNVQGSDQNLEPRKLDPEEKGEALTVKEGTSELNGTMDNFESDDHFPAKTVLQTDEKDFGSDSAFESTKITTKEKKRKRSKDSMQNTDTDAQLQDGKTQLVEEVRTEERKPIRSKHRMQNTDTDAELQDRKTQLVEEVRTKERNIKRSNHRMQNTDTKDEIDMGSPLPPIAGPAPKTSEAKSSSPNMDKDNHEKAEGTIPPEILKVLIGLCPFEELPPLPKKVVRIFVSSTFTDTKEERNALMQHVYPKLSDYCRDKHGLEFQIVDMRWGVPEQASDNHTTSELCIQEIKKCQEVSVGPNFVAIVGDKYGYRPVPRSVEEGLFQSLASTQITGWDLAEEWYKKDTNAVPAVYILQPISSKIQHYNNVENAELRTAAWGEWNRVNQQLSVTLRAAADRGYEGHTVTLMQKQLFYMSVTENEITTGVIEGKSNPSESCYCVIRKINDIDLRLKEAKAPRFIDFSPDQGRDPEAVSLLDDLRDHKLKHHVPESNVTMLDIEWSISGACMSLDNYKDVNVLKYAQKFWKDRKMGLFKHQEYIDSLCNEFFAKIRKLINDGTVKQMKIYDDLTTEILQHFHLAKMRCDVFEGREDILSETKKYLEEQDTSFPLVIYGNSGCGKTSVIAKIFENLSNRLVTNFRGSCFTVVARFLGTSTRTSNVHQLLVSMCLQLSIIFETPWKEPQQFSELVKSFYKLLQNATPMQPILLLLDSIDQLMPVYNAYKLYWLPEEFPPNVKLIASTIDEGYSILGAFKDKYASVGLKTLEVTPLGEQLGLDIITRWLRKDNRQVTVGQTGIIKEVLAKCSLPLYARIVYDHVRRWRSYDIPTADQLDTTVKGAINKLFQQMEEKFGKYPVQHSLSYLTASRYGLSEAELEHILSLDDLLLNKIFRLWNPPVRRVPPLIWTRIRSEIHSYIVERSADDQTVLYWYHRQFILTTKSRYLADNAFSNHITETLIEYFIGKWGSGQEKPFKYTNSQMKRFGLDQPESKADRKVPGQPYWTERPIYGKVETRYNKRKLSELPYHLLKKKDYDQLKEHIFFSFEWLFAKMKSASVQQMIEEVDIFMRADKVMKKDPEMKLLYANLQLIRPYVITYPDSLSYELSGRLAKYLGKYQHMTSLIKQCDCIGRKYCPLIPLTTCFETASLGFQQNLNFRSKEPWHEGGTFTSSPEFRTLYILDYNTEGLPIISSWDVESGDKIQELVIEKVKSEELKFTTDLYFQAECTKGGKELLGFFKQRMDATYLKKIKPGYGFIDVIDLESGKVKNTYETFLYRDEFFTPLLYLTENNMCVSHGWKMPLVNFTEDKTSSFNRPTLLSSDERFFIMCGKDKTILRRYDTKEFIAEFVVPEHQIAVTGSDDFSVVAMMGAESKDISIFDLANKLDRSSKQAYQLLKSKHVFKLEEKTTESVAVVFKPILETLEDGRIQEKRNNRVLMKISPDKRHLMVVFLGWKWMAFLWNINIDKYSSNFVGKYSAKFVGPITPYRMQCTSRYPQFSHDSSALVYSMGRRNVLIVSTENVEVTNEYTMKEDIKDIITSKVSNKVAVMLQKSVLLLNILKEDDNVLKGKGQKPAVTQLTEVLLPRETTKGVVQNEIIQKTVEENVELEEVEDLVKVVDTDRVASARSRSSQAVEKYYTPDGLRVLHLHRKVQVIDTVQEYIKYTPKPGETITRSVVGKDGTTVNEIIAIPDVSTRVTSGKKQFENADKSMDRAMKYSGKIPNPTSGRENLKQELLKPILTRSLSKNALSLRQGDRIVNENNKIKFRVTNESEGQLQVMVVPSVITVYTVEELKLHKLQRVSIYQESVLEVSNECFVTAKTSPLGHFVKVYDQVKGKSLAVHDMSFACECARFSMDHECLFVIDRSLSVKMLQGPQFTGVLRKFSILDAELSSAFVVKDIVQFQSNRDAILVKYGPEGPDVFVSSRYIFYDFISNKKSDEMNVSRKFEDISCDGRFGIDTALHLYDLQSGQLFAEMATHKTDIDYEGIIERRIRYTEAAVATEMIARISDDNKHIIYLDKTEDTLHFIHILGTQLKRVASCYAHAPAILAEKGVSLRHHGSVVLLKAKNRLMVIGLPHNKNQVYSYQSEYARCKSMMSKVSEKDDTKKNEKAKVSSVFQQRRLFMQQEDIRQKENAKKLNKLNKPSVLVIGEPILSIFSCEWFSPNLRSEKMSVQNIDDAFIKLRADVGTYDAIILQLITEDVTMYETPVCVKKMSVIVEMARQKARIVVLSYAPSRSDSKELSDKIKEVNEKLGVIYTSSCGGGRHLHLCKNGNLSDGVKPMARFFTGGSQLSLAGVKRISGNYKQILAPLLGMHHI